MNKLAGEDKKAVDRIEEVFNDRVIWESVWEEMADFYIPERWNLRKQFQPTDIYRHIYDSTPVNAADSLANMVTSGLIPSGAKWANLTPGPLVDSSRREGLLEKLQTVNDVMFNWINQSRLSTAGQPSILDCVVFGTGCIKIIKKTAGFTIANVPVEYLGLEEDHEGGFAAVHEKREITGRKFLTNPLWRKSLSEQQLKKLENNQKTEVVSSVIRISEEGTNQFMYRDIWWEEKVILDSRKMSRNPYIPFRWSKISDAPYGRGPGIANFGDTRAANKTREFILKSAAFDMLGVWLGRADGIMNPYATQLVPGEIMAVADTSNQNASLRRVDTGTNGFQIGQAVSADLRQSIREGFHSDKFGNNSRMTATEILAKNQEAQQSLGSTFGRIVDELLFPMVSNIIEILKEQKIIDVKDLKIDRELIDVVFLAPLAQAQLSNDVQNLLQFTNIAGQLSGLDQAAQYVVDIPKALRESAEKMSINRGVLRTVEQANAKAQEDAQAIAAQQQQLMQAQQQQAAQ